MYFASAIYLHRPVPEGSVSAEAARYVGVTYKTPEERLIEHISEARRSTEKNHRLNWLRSLKQPPAIEVLEYCFPWNRVEREKYWIALFRDYGHKLVNATEGGEGTPGLKHSLETIEKCRVASSGSNNAMFNKRGSEHPAHGRKHTAEEIAKMGHVGEEHWAHGRVLSAEHNEKLQSAARRNPPYERTAAHRAAISARHRGKTISQEQRDIVSKKLTGRKKPRK